MPQTRGVLSFDRGQLTCPVIGAGSPVTSDYGANGASHFSRPMNWVELDADTADDRNHLITPEERLRVAMPKQ